MPSKMVKETPALILGIAQILMTFVLTELVVNTSILDEDVSETRVDEDNSFEELASDTRLDGVPDTVKSIVLDGMLEVDAVGSAVDKGMYVEDVVVTAELRRLEVLEA